jgi:hypothetical protein
MASHVSPIVRTANWGIYKDSGFLSEIIDWGAGGAQEATIQLQPMATIRECWADGASFFFFLIPSFKKFGTKSLKQQTDHFVS